MHLKSFKYELKKKAKNVQNDFGILQLFVYCKVIKSLMAQKWLYQSTIISYYMRGIFYDSDEKTIQFKVIHIGTF